MLTYFLVGYRIHDHPVHTKRYFINDFALGH